MKKPTQHSLKILKIIGLTALTIILLLSIFVTFFLKGIVTQRLKDQVSQTFGDFYALSFDKSSTSLSSSGFNISFQEVVFESDTANKFMLRRYPALFFKTNALSINDINIFDLFLHSTIDVNRVSLEKPQLLFFIPKKEKEESPENKDATPINKDKKKNQIEKIRVGQFSLTEGKASFVFHKNSSDTLYAGKNVNVEMENLGINLASSQSILMSSTLDQLYFSLEEVLLNPKESDYKFMLGGIKFDYTGEQLRLNNLQVVPKGDPVQMAKNAKFRKTIFDVKMDTLVYHSRHFKQLRAMDTVQGQTLRLVNLNMKLDRNKDVPLDQSQYKKLFHQSLLDLPFVVDIDSVEVNNASIDYKVHTQKENNPGNLFLTQLNGTIQRLYTSEAKKDTVKADFEGRFMKSAPFTFQARMPLNDPDNHTYQGHIGSMDFTALNPLLANLTRIKLAEGRINSIYFDGRANKLNTWGTMRSDFNGLKLKVTDSNNKERWLQSGLGNLVARKDNRTNDQGTVEPMEYTFERPPYKDHLTLYGEGLINGFALSMLPKSVYKLIMPQ